MKLPKLKLPKLNTVSKAIMLTIIAVILAISIIVLFLSHPVEFIAISILVFIGLVTLWTIFNVYKFILSKVRDYERFHSK